MDAQVADHFAHIVSSAAQIFEQVEHSIDYTPQRSMLSLHANYGPFRILVMELFSDAARKYRYYVLRDDWVVAGFDNSPDPRAIRLKHGKIGLQYAGELVPHLHLHNKTALVLTDDFSFPLFIEWLQMNLQP